MTADRAIRYLTAVVVAAVAAFAAVVSYGHIYDLARHNGQTLLAARLLPLSVDGLIVAASLVLLHEARARRGAPLLGQSMLALGVGATLAANVGYGAAYGWVGAVVSAWPAVAFIGSAEMAFMLARRIAQPAATEPVPARHAASGARVAPVPADALDAATVAYRASVAVHSPLSARELDRRYGIGRPAAAKVVSRVNAEMGNGHHGHPGELVADGG